MPHHISVRTFREDVIWGPLDRGAGNPTRFVAAKGGTAEEETGVGRASAAGGVASDFKSAARRETRFGAFLAISSAGASIVTRQSWTV